MRAEAQQTIEAEARAVLGFGFSVGDTPPLPEVFRALAVHATASGDLRFTVAPGPCHDLSATQVIRLKCLLDEFTHPLRWGEEAPDGAVDR
jgi:hypothetical protein